MSDYTSPARPPGRPKRDDEASAPAVSPSFSSAPVPTIDPPVDPAFESAVAAAVRKALADMGLAGSSAPSISGADHNFLDRMAMSIATLSQQGSGKVYVAPAVLQSRAEARERMDGLIAETMRGIAEARAAGVSEDAMRVRGLWPTYQLTARIQLMGDYGPEVVEPLWQDKDRVVQATVIDWEGQPNEAMRPQNERAKAIFEAYTASIGNNEKFEPKLKIGLSARGRVVTGNAVNPRMERNPLNDSEPRDEGSSRFRVHNAGAPGRVVQKHILGTIAPPAQFQV